MVRTMEKKINKIVEQKKEIFAILASNECASSFEDEKRILKGHSMECALRYLRQQVNPVEVRSFMADNFFNLYELMGDFRGRELAGVDGDSVDDVESYYDKVEEIIALAWEFEHTLINDKKPYGDISAEKEILNKKISALAEDIYDAIDNIKHSPVRNEVINRILEKYEQSLLRFCYHDINDRFMDGIDERTLFNEFIMQNKTHDEIINSIPFIDEFKSKPFEPTEFKAAICRFYGWLEEIASNQEDKAVLYDFIKKSYRFSEDVKLLTSAMLDNEYLKKIVKKLYKSWELSLDVKAKNIHKEKVVLLGVK